MSSSPCSHHAPQEMDIDAASTASPPVEDVGQPPSQGSGQLPSQAQGQSPSHSQRRLPSSSLQPDVNPHWRSSAHGASHQQSQQQVQQQRLHDEQYYSDHLTRVNSHAASGAASPVSELGHIPAQLYSHHFRASHSPDRQSPVSQLTSPHGISSSHGSNTARQQAGGPGAAVQILLDPSM